MCDTVVSFNLDYLSSLELSFSVNNALCNDSNDGSVIAQIAGGLNDYNYLWNNGETTPQINNLHSGTYSVVVTDANDCVIDGQAIVSSPNDLVMDFLIYDVVCPNQNNGSILGEVYGGVSPYTYQWSNGDNTQNIVNLSEGDYSLSLIDSNGCTVDSIFIVGSGSGPQTSVIAGSNEVSLFTEHQYSISQTQNSFYYWNVVNGSITTNQGDPFTVIQWGNEGIGVVNVVETDSNGCVGDTISLVVSVLDLCALNPLQISFAITDANCGVDDGAVEINVSGGNGLYSYLWNNGATSSEISNLSVGVYSVTVTDSNNCSSTEYVNVSSSFAPEITIISENISCYGLNDGNAEVFVQGGVEPYSFQWSNGSSVSSINNLSLGEYVITVSDADNCSVSDLVNITSPEELIMNYNTSEFICPGQNTGFVQGEVIGGTSPYYFEWDNGETTPELQNISIGEYNLTVTDFNGCTVDSVFNIFNGQVPQTGNIIGQNQVAQFSSEQYLVSQTLGSTYFWFIENGAIASGQGVNVVNVQWGNVGIGKLSVVEVGLNGCQGDTVNTTVSIGNTGIWSKNNNNLIKVYPNPTNGLVNIEVENYSGTVYTKVYDLIGNLIILSDTKIINTQYFSRGVYLLEISFGNTVREMKLIRN